MRSLVAALLFGLSAAAVARAADPANVAAVEPFLRDDEKAFLAGVLIDRSASAEFDADVALGKGDPKVMKLVLDKWRGRLAAFAASEASHGTPDVEGTYKNYGAMMTAPMRAYLVRLLKTMKEDDRNTLIEYLDGVNEALNSNNGHLTWYTKKVVAGVFDKYRGQMTAYLATPIGRAAPGNAPAAEAALAALKKPAVAPAPVPDPGVAERERLAKEQAERERLAREAAARKKPPVVADPNAKPGDPGFTVTNPPVSEERPLPLSPEALEQLRRAKEAADRAGGNFDGSVNRDANTGGVVAGPSHLGGAGLTQPGGDPKPSLTGEVPTPGDADDSFLSDVKKMKTGSGSMSPRKYLPAASGAVVGVIAGALLFGLVGALVGLLVGAVIGHLVGKKLFK